jgi:hypothetical protein
LRDGIRKFSSVYSRHSRDLRLSPSCYLLLYTHEHFSTRRPQDCHTSLFTILPVAAGYRNCIEVRSTSYFGVRSSSCGRQTVDQFVLVSGLPLGPLTRFYLALLFSFDSYFILLPMAFSLTRKRVCSLQCNHSLVRPLTTNNHTLPSHSRLCSLSVASYDSQGLRWRYSNPPPHGEVQSSRVLPATYCVTLPVLNAAVTIRVRTRGLASIKLCTLPISPCIFIS